MLADLREPLVLSDIAVEVVDTLQLLLWDCSEQVRRALQGEPALVRYVEQTRTDWNRRDWAGALVRVTHGLQAMETVRSNRVDHLVPTVVQGMLHGYAGGCHCVEQKSDLAVRAYERSASSFRASFHADPLQAASLCGLAVAYAQTSHWLCVSRVCTSGLDLLHNLDGSPTLSRLWRRLALLRDWADGQHGAPGATGAPAPGLATGARPAAPAPGSGNAPAAGDALRLFRTRVEEPADVHDAR
ncbi:MAG: hypothetical protein HY784_03935 [Chloroflexi bacterium]|nr:hypothetical protein [Chloroflexota bacterium]